MVYLWLTAIKDTRVRRLLTTYDIMCAWDVHLLDRIAEAPQDIRIDPDKFEVFMTGIPNFHIHGHQAKCQSYSLHFKKGVGQTCGEIIEVGWSVSNPAAGATASMSAGARADWLDDLWNDANWQKCVRMRESSTP